jgi:hypothetical protein
MNDGRDSHAKARVLNKSSANPQDFRSPKNFPEAKARSKDAVNEASRRKFSTFPQCA